MSDRFAYDMPYGAQWRADGLTRFRLWAPDVDEVAMVCAEADPEPMRALDDGWFECVCAAPPGLRYSYRIGADTLVADPASRLQHGGDVHGASVVVDPRSYAWRFPDWKGRPWREVVIYELHVGLFGGFAGVAEALPRLAELGITAIELMPIAQFPGARNWGYDGVLPFAPASVYGSPDELKGLIDEAHRLGLMVFIDVVYNHFGPDGNLLGMYASRFFHEADTPWGSAVAVAVPQVGDFFLHNVLYWLNEYRFDGLRFDAVHALENSGWLNALASRVRAHVEPDRHVHLVLENEDNQAHLLGERGFDAQWNDDFHNALHVVLTGETDGYYEAFAERPIDKLARTLSEGFAWQGERMFGKVRGEPSGQLNPYRFVDFLQNHDHVGNRPLGDRLAGLVAGPLLDAAHALLLLSPSTPLLFMGEEWSSRTPFLYFSDHQDESLREAVSEGRRKEFAAFGGHVPWADPNDAETFARSMLTADEADRPEAVARRDLIRHLLTLRRDFLTPWLDGCRFDDARVLGDKALSACWLRDADTRLHMHANFGDTAIVLERTSEGPLTWLYGDAMAFADGQLPPSTTFVYLEPMS
jgi:malto-oligosyltrehalose trehalohydrolase